MLNWKENVLPSLEEQRSVQSAQTFLAPIGPRQPWGKEEILAVAQNHALLSVTLIATAVTLLLTGYTLHACSLNSYSGVAADSCWQMRCSIHATFQLWGFFFLAACLADRVGKKSALTEHYIIKNGSGVCSWNIVIDGVKNSQRRGRNVYTVRDSVVNRWLGAFQLKQDSVEKKKAAAAPESKGAQR